ncbi:MAG: hypothetical protein E4H14_00465 [Candidatus Thorarchaeota archaeon]|nr:MAG: hypothetical protein E4H14_00465 [Candidatus Thorarchaeota archaeon]
MKRKSIVIFLLFAIVLGMPMIAMDNSPSSQDDGMLFNAVEITASIYENGEVTFETEFYGSDTVNYEVFAEFTPSYEVDGDYQNAVGLLGEVIIWVYGYYNYLDTEYYMERHRGTYDSLLGGNLQNVIITCRGDNVYEDEYYTYGSWVTYYEDIDNVCSSRFQCDVYWGIFPFTSVDIEAVIYGP